MSSANDLTIEDSSSTYRTGKINDVAGSNFLTQAHQILPVSTKSIKRNIRTNNNRRLKTI